MNILMKDTFEYSRTMGLMQGKLFKAESRRLRRNQPLRVDHNTRLYIYKLFYTEMAVTFEGVC